MLNFSRNDRPGDAKDPVKPTIKPTPYGLSPQGGATKEPAARAPTVTPPPTPAPTTMRETNATANPEPTPASQPGAPEGPGSKLIVGVNIKLKGVEISNCDVLVIEGQVEATVHSKAMEISKPGTLTGTAQIDVAEIHGEFSGELTARTKLVVHGTGRVTGTIRYGKLVVAEGGTLTGDLRQIDSPASETPTLVSAAPDLRSLLSSQP